MEITIIDPEGTTYKNVKMEDRPMIGEYMDMKFQDEGTPGHIVGVVAMITWTAPYAITVTVEEQFTFDAVSEDESITVESNPVNEETK